MMKRQVEDSCSRPSGNRADGNGFPGTVCWCSGAAVLREGWAVQNESEKKTTD